MTGPEHYLEGERLLESAAAIMNADYGWMASLSTEERLAHRTADIAAAQAHFTAAQAAATALGAQVTTDEYATGMDPLDRSAWDKVAGVQPS